MFKKLVLQITMPNFFKFLHDPLAVEKDIHRKQVVTMDKRTSTVEKPPARILQSK